MGTDIGSIGLMDIASSNALFIAVDIILILLALILLVRYRSSRIKRKAETESFLNPKNEQKNELFGIDIKPEEFKSDRLEMKTDLLASLKPPETTPGTVSESVDLTKSASSTLSITQEAAGTQEPMPAMEPIKVPQPITALEPGGSVPNNNNVSVIQPENMEPPGAEVPEIGEFELEDEFIIESPEEFTSSSEPEIPETEGEMLEEEIDFSLGQELTPQEEEIPPAPTLPLELHLKPPDKEDKNTSENTRLPFGLDMMEKKDDVRTADISSVAPESSIPQLEPGVMTTDTVGAKSEEVLSVAPESSIPQPEPAMTTDMVGAKSGEALSVEQSIPQPQTEVKTSDTIDVKPVDVSSVVPEQTIEQPEPEIKLFNFEAMNEAKPKKPPDQVRSPIKKEEESAAEDASEIKLFDFDAKIKAKPETARSNPEQGQAQPESGGDKPAEVTSDPEIKLFNFEAGMESKYKPVASSPGKVTPETPVAPVAGIASGDVPNQDRKEKKAKRKSLF